MSRSLLLLPALLLSAQLSASDVYQWKSGKGGNVYSDTPAQLHTGKAKQVTVRTAPAGTSSTAAEAPAAGTESAEAVAQREAVEKQNREIAEQNRRREQMACQEARSNLARVNGMRVENREELAAQFNAQVREYCK